MSDGDWYRNTDWDDEIAARFESRIARSRTQKAQYLLIQGTLLIASQPAVAAPLFERSIALNDEFHLARALNGLAMARMALGEIDACLAAYEAAIDTELRLPGCEPVHWPTLSLLSRGTKGPNAMGSPKKYLRQHNQALFREPTFSSMPRVR